MDMIRDETRKGNARVLNEMPKDYADDPEDSIIDAEINHSSTPEFRRALKNLKDQRLDSYRVDAAVGNRLMEKDIKGATALLRIKTKSEPRKKREQYAFSSEPYSIYGTAKDTLLKGVEASTLAEKKKALYDAARLWANANKNQIKDNVVNDSFHSYMPLKQLVGQIFRMSGKVSDYADIGDLLQDVLYNIQGAATEKERRTSLEHLRNYLKNRERGIHTPPRF